METATMTETEKKINEIHTAVMVIAESVSDHKKALFGNGQPGLKSRVDILETKQKDCKGRQLGNKQNAMLATAIISSGVAIISVLINFFKSPS